MKIWTLPSVNFATLVLLMRIWLVAVFVAVLFVPSITHAKTKPKVAVLYFDNNSGDSKLNPLSKGFADMLITDISQSEQVTVVEREKLQALLDESKLQQSRYFNPKTAVTIGKGLGASHVVAGAFVTSAPRMRVDVRLIEIATGKVILSSKVSGSSDDIFELEQELVEKFLAELKIRFTRADLPATKVPNLKTLLSYSQALGLVDLGQNAQAALQFKKVVSMAPAFALARVRHKEILARVELAKTQRAQVLDRGVQTLYTNARAFHTTNKLPRIAEKEAGQRLSYWVILRHEAGVALYATLQGKRKGSRVVPHKRAQQVRNAVRKYYEVQRQLIAEESAFRERFPKAYSPFDLPDADKALARELGLDYQDGDMHMTMLRFLLAGRVSSSGLLKSYNMSPAPSDLDPRLKRAGLALATSLVKQPDKLPKVSRITVPVRALEALAEFHIGRERIEEGIAAYQKILDGYPSIKRWSFYEKQIQKELGLAPDHLASKRKEYRKALQTCDKWKINASIGPMLASRIRHQGLQALPNLYKEVEKACKNSPLFPGVQKIVFRNLASKAGGSGDCSFVKLYQNKWIELGGSARDAKLLRTRYGCK